MMDFVKRSHQKSVSDTNSRWGYGSQYESAKRTPNNDVFGYGSDGYLYNFVKREHYHQNPQEEIFWETYYLIINLLHDM